MRRGSRKHLLKHVPKEQDAGDDGKWLTLAILHGLVESQISYVALTPEVLAYFRKNNLPVVVARPQQAKRSGPPHAAYSPHSLDSTQRYILCGLFVVRAKPVEKVVTKEAKVSDPSERRQLGNQERQLSVAEERALQELLLSRLSGDTQARTRLPLTPNATGDLAKAKQKSASEEDAMSFQHELPMDEPPSLPQPQPSAAPGAAGGQRQVFKERSYTVNITDPTQVPELLLRALKAAWNDELFPRSPNDATDFNILVKIVKTPPGGGQQQQRGARGAEGLMSLPLQIRTYPGEPGQPPNYVVTLSLPDVFTDGRLPPAASDARPDDPLPLYSVKHESKK
ncbi:hypothetical protein AAG570_011641 [Ranatra chinensis]|uniref:Uncharacterized protein n=1 Tax=Ranatra chinensis TaxID=642074 RepID=A0ABD0YL92_9HEMI